MLLINNYLYLHNQYLQVASYHPLLSAVANNYFKLCYFNNTLILAIFNLQAWI